MGPSSVMGEITSAAERLPTIGDADQWERAVEALLLLMAKEIEAGTMRRADHTRKTQALAEERRAGRMHTAHRDNLRDEQSGAAILGTGY